MKKTFVTLLLLIVLGLFAWSIVKQGAHSPASGRITPDEIMRLASKHLPPLGTQALPNQIRVTKPSAGDVITSPVEISGQASGPWFFEASAPVKIFDLTGALLGTGHIEALGDWMTTDLVNFTGTITFTTTNVSTAGVILLENDNPSGQASTSRYIAVPVVFSSK